MKTISKVLTLEQAADYLAVTPEELQVELEKKLFRVLRLPAGGG